VQQKKKESEIEKPGAEIEIAVEGTNLFFGDGKANFVVLRGKISQRKRLTYTPTGTPICHFMVAVPQRYFEKDSIGYFEVVMVGKLAEEKSEDLKIGRFINIEGHLWNRSFKDRQGRMVRETKIIVEKIHK